MESLYNRIAQNSDPEHICTQYLWGKRPGHRDELVLRDRRKDCDAHQNERIYCLMDYYNPIAIVSSSGEVVERYGWSVYGLSSVLTPGWDEREESLYDWNFGFHGKFFETSVGLSDYGFRDYSPWIGRWISRDPIGETGGQNLYKYSENNPLNTNDPFGLTPYQSCNIFLLVDHGAHAQEEFNTWSTYGGLTSTPNGEPLPHYAAMAAFGCDTCAHSENIQPACPTNPPDGFGPFVGWVDPFQGELPAWNGGFNRDAKPNHDIDNQVIGFIKLIAHNWGVALALGQSFSEKCASDEFCCCSEISVHLMFGTERFIDFDVTSGAVFEIADAAGLFQKAWERIRGNGLAGQFLSGEYTTSDFPNLIPDKTGIYPILKTPNKKVSATFEVR